VKNVSEKPEKKKTASEDVEELKEVLSAVSTEVPALIKSIIASVFSEEAGRNMGKAAAAFYKELKDGGMPDNVAVKMTENYIGVFTSLGDILKRMGEGKGKVVITGGEKGKEVEDEVEKRIKEKLAEKRRTEAEEEEE
jgi:TATA-box binding protein (TBP) (component of TFIID and TFIIIB)